VGEIINNVNNYVESSFEDTDNNINLSFINPQFLPTPKTKLNHSVSNIVTVSKFKPAKDKGTAKVALKKKSVETAQLNSLTLSNANSILANADSGATGTYLRIQDIQVLRNVKVSLPADQITVAVAEGTLIRSTHHGYLDVPGHGAMLAHIFPQLHGSLLSISQLVNLGLHVSYCANFVTFFDSEDKAVVQGNRDLGTGLWMVDLRSLSTATTGKTHQVASAAIRLDSVSDFVNFWHAAYGSPAVSTFVSAIDNNFIRVPGLTAAKVRRNPPNSLATAYGQLHAFRKGLHSTKKTTSVLTIVLRIFKNNARGEYGGKWTKLKQDARTRTLQGRYQ
jgi:hypothetical protein